MPGTQANCPEQWPRGRGHQGQMVRQHFMRSHQSEADANTRRMNRVCCISATTLLSSQTSATSDSCRGKQYYDFAV